MPFCDIKLTITPIYDEAAIPAIIELAEEIENMGFGEIRTVEDALFVIFTDPGGPARLIEIEGVDGWIVDPKVIA